MDYPKKSGWRIFSRPDYPAFERCGGDILVNKILLSCSKFILCFESSLIEARKEFEQNLSP